VSGTALRGGRGRPGSPLRHGPRDGRAHPGSPPSSWPGLTRPP